MDTKLKSLTLHIGYMYSIKVCITELKLLYWMIVM